jgi:hypothetical protein
MLVSGWQQAIAVILAVVPGFVYQGALAQWSGPNPANKDFTVRVVRALAFSGAAALIYVVALGHWLTDIFRKPFGSIEHPRVTGLVLLVLVFVIPVVVAAVQHYWVARRAFPQKKKLELFRLFNPTPTAWDYATRRLEPGAVRILTKDGTWIGGIAAEDAFFTGYPELREVFLDVPYQLNEEGTFQGPIDGGTGMWIRCDDVQLVQFLQAGDTEPSAEQGDQDRPGGENK